MNVPALIVGLYPPGVRQRWGSEMAREVAASGPRSWPDTAAGAVRLWAHPGDWPETSSGQTRRVLAVTLFAVMTAAALLLRAAGSSAFLTEDPGHPAASAWLMLTLVGAMLSAPLPPPGWDALRRLAAVSVRSLAAPVLALLALYTVAHSGLVDHPVRAVRLLLPCYYWGTLCFTGTCLCALMARISRVAIMPGIRRLRSALLLIGAGFALAAGQSLAATMQTALNAGPLALSCALAALAAAAITIGHDLRATKPPEPHASNLPKCSKR
ncbi:MAG: hypothetical protein M3Z75_19310 [Actinomycetota bacterium]|nr:hypothetical protein [Actinomycetota bacterium]